MNFYTATTGYQTKTALLVFLAMCTVIATVLALQHIGGYIPCKLCLGQREPYYIAIPLGFVALLSAWRNWPACLTRGLLAICGLLLLLTAFLGAFHAGVEWAWWQGPTDCGAVSGGSVTSAEDLLNQLTAQRPPSCDEAAGRFLGISFAGWNVVVALIIATIAFKGALKKAD